MLKIENRDIAYYFDSKALYDNALPSDSHLRRLALASVAVDLRTNTLIKSRLSLDILMDKAFKDVK